MDQDGPSRPPIVTEQPVSRNEMMRDPGVQRRRGPPAQNNGAASDEERTQIRTPGRAACATPGHPRRRRRRTEAGMMSDGILGLLFCLSGLMYCF
ncbi:hypothetical protein LZ30DRAFT_705591 [Colletotrichum cereale]|nr:hypothetical protein LZ30DRAFT_705591 [Colletotrichum cereale]